VVYQPLVALVGLPDTSQAVIESTGELAALLAKEGMVVVTGLARGMGRASFDGGLSTTDGEAIAVLPMGICALHEGQEGLTREMAAEALVMGKGVYVWDFGSAAEPASAGTQALFEAGAVATSSLSHVLDLMEVVVEASLEQQAAQESSPAMSPHHPTDDTAAPLEPMDPQTTLNLLSKAGRVPGALIKPLEKS